MTDVLYILGGTIVWIYLGAIVIAVIDDEDETAARCAREAPSFLLGMSIRLLWPVVVILYLMCKRDCDKL